MSDLAFLASIGGPLALAFGLLLFAAWGDEPRPRRARRRRLRLLRGGR